MWAQSLTDITFWKVKAETAVLYWGRPVYTSDECVILPEKSKSIVEGEHGCY